MGTEEYKETVLYELENASGKEEVEQIINRSGERLPGNDLFRHWLLFTCVYYKMSCKIYPGKMLIHPENEIYFMP